VRIVETENRRQREVRERPDPEEQGREREQKQDGGKESKDDILREWGQKIERVEELLEKWRGGEKEKGR